MTYQRLAKFGAALFLAALAVGCSSKGDVKTSATGNKIASAHADPDGCLKNRKSCIHEGRYEKNEAAFAVDEAKRLNKISMAKLKRDFRR